MVKNLDILLLEDNPVHIDRALDEANLVWISENEKFKVDIAKNFSQYFDLLETKKYDGIVSDFFFPLATVLLDDALKKNIPFVFCTNKTYSELKRKSYYHYAREKGIFVVANTEQNEGPDWWGAFDMLLAKIRSKSNFGRYT